MPQPRNQGLVLDFVPIPNLRKGDVSTSFPWTLWLLVVRSVSECSWPQFLRQGRSRLGQETSLFCCPDVCSMSALLTNGHTAL